MRFRNLVLAGAATLAFATPALADGAGWYLGLGVGYDHLNRQTVTGDFPDKVVFSDSAIYLASAGYKFDNGIRLEGELSFDEHKSTRIECGFVECPFKTLKSGWGATLGAGIGVANINEYIHNEGGVFQIVAGARTAFEWQAIAGLTYAISDDVDIFADYRFRSAEVDQDYFNTSIGSVHLNENQEHVALLGLRWYLQEAPPPPPPPAPAPPPPPLPPPPVKTFIVFFDFDKSNLTAEAQSVVTEAVKTAKANGFVKVMVTGHTDTVGSDNYNQALSVRRAESVKDEMVRQGMDGGSIAIEGKSFHDPLVPTGPGVREPQNRRAVIDLGG